jgi:hypothetical protein
MARDWNLLLLALALAPDRPKDARRLLIEGSTVQYENSNNLLYACVGAGRLGDWPQVLQTASRLLHFDRRTGRVPRLLLVNVLSFVARALAPSQPAPAAVLLGTARALNLAPSEEPLTPSGQQAATGSLPNVIADLIRNIRHDAAQLIIASLGEQRMRELRAQGADMDRDQACAYARIHIDEHLATDPGDVVRLAR